MEHDVPPELHGAVGWVGGGVLFHDVLREFAAVDGLDTAFAIKDDEVFVGPDVGEALVAIFFLELQGRPGVANVINGGVLEAGVEVAVFVEQGGNQMIGRFVAVEVEGDFYRVGDGVEESDGAGGKGLPGFGFQLIASVPTTTQVNDHGHHGQG